MHSGSNKLYFFHFGLQIEYELLHESADTRRRLSRNVLHALNSWDIVCCNAKVQRRFSHIYAETCETTVTMIRTAWLEKWIGNFICAANGTWLRSE